MTAAGFPHSDTAGSSLPYSSPTLFAVWRVLPHSGVARHPPYALPYLISGSRVFFEMFTLQRTVLNCFSLKILVYNFRLDLFCYVFFMLFSFQRSLTPLPRRAQLYYQIFSPLSKKMLNFFHRGQKRANFPYSSKKLARLYRMNQLISTLFYR